MAEKAARAVVDRERLLGFRELIDADGFGVLVAVPTAAKASEVESAIEPLVINRLVPVRVVVIPELLPLLLQGRVESSPPTVPPERRSARQHHLSTPPPPIIGRHRLPEGRAAYASVLRFAVQVIIVSTLGVMAARAFGSYCPKLGVAPFGWIAMSRSPSRSSNGRGMAAGR